MFRERVTRETKENTENTSLNYLVLSTSITKQVEQGMVGSAPNTEEAGLCYMNGWGKNSTVCSFTHLSCGQKSNKMVYT